MAAAGTAAAVAAVVVAVAAAQHEAVQGSGRPKGHQLCCRARRGAEQQWTARGLFPFIVSSSEIWLRRERNVAESSLRSLQYVFKSLDFA